MPKITFLLKGSNVPQSIEANSGESILEAASRAGIPMQHTCGGFASCGTCHVKVKTGSQGLSPMTSDERTLLKYESGATESSRLACQTKVTADATVEVVNTTQQKAA